MFNILLIVADTTGEAENAAVKGVFRFRTGGKTNAYLIWGERRFSGIEKESGVGKTACGDAPGADGIEHPAQIPGDAAFRPQLGFRKVPAQQLQ